MSIWDPLSVPVAFRLRSLPSRGPVGGGKEPLASTASSRLQLVIMDIDQQLQMLNLMVNEGHISADTYQQVSFRLRSGARSRCGRMQHN